MYCSFLNQELFDDDRVTPDYFALNYDTYFHLFGLNAQVSTTKDAQGNDSIGYHYEPIVEDLEDDYGKLGPSVFGVDLDTTEKKRQAIENAIGDILPVRMQMNCLTSVPTQEVVHFMGMENMMYAMYDYPDLYKKMMDRIADDTLAYYHMLEEKRLILPTTAFEGVSQGSWAFNRELPGWDEWEKRPFTTKDVWGFMDSQESVGISPAMYEEFIFPCYEKISRNFGLFSYGCCEPVDPIWDNCISKLPNLRKVSISPGATRSSWVSGFRAGMLFSTESPVPIFLAWTLSWTRMRFARPLTRAFWPPEGAKWKSPSGTSTPSTTTSTKPGGMFRSSGKRLINTGSKQEPPSGKAAGGYSLSKASQRLPPLAANRVQSVFCRGLYLAENTSQVASVEFVPHRGTNYARSRLPKFAPKARRGFPTVTNPQRPSRWGYLHIGEISPSHRRR